MEIINFIKELKKKGKVYYNVWLPILFELEENHNYTLKRNLDVSKTQYYRIIAFGIQKWNELVPLNLENTKGVLSITNKKDSKKTVKAVKPKKESEPKVVNEKIDMAEVYESIISYLNQRAKTNYKFTTNSYRTFINARLKNGAKLEDFYAVIDNKCNEWMDTDFQKFLRPETLFGNKFETYLNQKIIQKTTQEKTYDKVSEATKLGWADKSQSF